MPIPYGRAVISDGRYGVACPACEFVAWGPATGSEDRVTKEAGRLYAEHWAEHEQERKDAEEAAAVARYERRLEDRDVAREWGGIDPGKEFGW